jgi:hypothetical protein
LCGERCGREHRQYQERTGRHHELSYPVVIPSQ